MQEALNRWAGISKNNLDYLHANGGFPGKQIFTLGRPAGGAGMILPKRAALGDQIAALMEYDVGALFPAVEDEVPAAAGRAETIVIAQPQVRQPQLRLYVVDLLFLEMQAEVAMLGGLADLGMNRMLPQDNTTQFLRAFMENDLSQLLFAAARDAVLDPARSMEVT